jgi:hypothetical protein
LVSKKCYSQAREIFKRISVTNKRPPYNFRLIEEIEFENETYLKYRALCHDIINVIVDRVVEDKKQVK